MLSNFLYIHIIAANKASFGSSFPILLFHSFNLDIITWPELLIQMFFACREIRMIFLPYLYIRASLCFVLFCFFFDKSIWSDFKKYNPEVYLLIFYSGFLYLCSQNVAFWYQ